MENTNVDKSKNFNSQKREWIAPELKSNNIDETEGKFFTLPYEITGTPMFKAATAS